MVQGREQPEEGVSSRAHRWCKGPGAATAQGVLSKGKCVKREEWGWGVTRERGGKKRIRKGKSKRDLF